MLTTAKNYKDACGNDVAIDVSRLAQIKGRVEDTEDKTAILAEDENYLIQLFQISQIENFGDLENEVFGVLYQIYEKYFMKCISEYESVAEGAVTIDEDDLMRQRLTGFIVSLMKYDVSKSEEGAHKYLFLYIGAHLADELRRFSGATSKTKGRIEKAKKIRAAISDYQEKHGCEPDSMEISRMTGITYRSVVLYRNLFDNDTVPLHSLLADGCMDKDIRTAKFSERVLKFIS
jgi:hypothetical protein